jgi:hypothetical protein
LIISWMNSKQAKSSVHYTQFGHIFKRTIGVAHVSDYNYLKNV